MLIKCENDVRKLKDGTYVHIPAVKGRKRLGFCGRLTGKITYIGTEAAQKLRVGQSIGYCLLHVR